MTPRALRSAIGPLRLVFWGALASVLDVGLELRSGFEFDILNDFVGAILIALGVWKLASIRLHERYENAMTLVRVLAVAGVIVAFAGHVSLILPPILAILVFGVLLVYIFFALVAAIVFCIAMRWLCIEAGLAEAAESWKVTTILFTVIYALPMAIWTACGLVVMALRGSHSVDIGPFAIVLMLVFFVPAIHFFISTSRMKRAIERYVQSPL